MVSVDRGQPPAWQTKVVDHGLGPLKAYQKCLYVPVCDNDTALTKPTYVCKPTLCIIVQLINVVLLAVKCVDI